MSRRGLPAGVGLRRDAHYVEELAGRGPVPVGRLIAVDRLYPNPDQPRVEIGDLTELIASVREKGILEPLLVRPSNERPGYWMIIAGERRWRAAREAGLREVPCIELEVDDRAVAEIALIENLQRKDLTPWEEADGLLALSERFGYTHEEIARKVGKSRSTVTEALSIATLPPEIRERCRRADITSKSLLLQIVRQPDEEAMRRMVDEIIRRGMTRDEARAARRASGAASKRAAPYTFRHQAADGEYRVEVRFRRAQVEPSEVRRALEAALAALDGR
ncbi:ParB/RepB/Spo0J family partition protein [Pyrinomonas methylaliphatogenes]|uniref:ParB-like partition protein n=1 Tax=Pyrinomonas methylaliphatogenes TaxID=454194 RepID=A0A0B6WUS8_9BACT|nr:ParB/RepB/Spo0J family partition protein [Pyrinomonas methylaliphatogenes]CDM64806.1 ParB-like partition protein [Pyrinomonas methylaliphatogenes]